jgi:hypothetical protein
MPKREIYYGTDRWRDPKFDVVAARDWLAAIVSDDPNLLAMLRRVAGGEYENINMKITEFVVDLQRSKHSDNDEVMSKFFKEIVEDLIQNLDLEKVTTEGLGFLEKNKVLVDLPDIRARIISLIAERRNSLMRKRKVIKRP